MNTHEAPSPSPPPPPRSTATDGFFGSVRRLSVWRSNDRWAAGVAAGIAHRYNVDPLVIRGIFVVATLFGGLGLVLYGLAWMLLPEASDGRIHLEQAVRGHFDIALAGAIGVAVVGLSRPVFWWTGSWWALPWTVALVAVIAVVLLSGDRARTGPPPGSPTYPLTPDASPAGTSDPATAGTPYPMSADPMARGTAAGATAAGPDVQEDALSHSTTDPSSPAPGDTGSSATPAYAVELAGTSDDTESPAGTSRPTEPLDGSPGHTEQLPGSADQTQPLDGSGWGSGWGGGDWDHGGATPPPPGPPPAPPRPPVPGPGSRLSSLVLAVVLLATAAVVGAHQVGALTGNVWLLAGGTALTLLGLGVLVSGIRGRSQGGIGGLALVLAILLVPAAAASAVVPGFSRLGASGSTTVTGDHVWTPTTAQRAEDGYSLVAGELLVDLTELDADAQVPASVTFGNLHVLVPEDAAVTVNARVAGGEVLGRVGDEWTTGGGGRWDSAWADDTISNGMGVDVTLSREGARGAPEIVVDAEVTFGQIIIEETS